MRRALVLAFPALVGLAAASGCGKSKEHELMDQRHAACDRLIPNGETVRQAANDFGMDPDTIECDVPQRFSLPVGSKCDASTPLCRRLFRWFANDQSLCSPFGCVYLCETFAPVGPLGPAVVDDSPLCAAQFASGQPLFF